jgi:acyl-CoA thioesterase I
VSTLRQIRPSRATLLALILVGVAAASALVLTPAGRHASAAGAQCGVPDEFTALARPLPHLARRLKEGGTLTIVALGSSSTSGTGASKPQNTYPSRLAVALSERFPELKVRVVNRGIAGEEAPAMVARIERDVLPEKPDLVIWQLGTNSVLHDVDAAAGYDTVVRAGVARMEAAGEDVMLMNLQYAPAVLQHGHLRDMLRTLDRVAYGEDVPLFPRFAIMRHWIEDGRMPLSAMVSPDRLHMTDTSYDCLARELAAGIDVMYRGGRS